MIEQVRAYIERHSLLQSGVKVLVGVSGGVDSMTLLTILPRLGYDVWALHVNYGLRAGDSDQDAALVQRYCAELQIPLEVESVIEEIQDRSTGSSIQARARKIRYRLLTDRAVGMDINAVAVAHHQDDQAETVLLALLRKSGFDGLAGMRSKRSMHTDRSVTLVRPFLDMSRNDIVAFAQLNRIPWREDDSNLDLSFKRAVVRSKIIPQLESMGDTHFVRDVCDMALVMRNTVDEDLPACLPTGLDFETVKNGSVPAEPLLKLDPAVRGWYLLRVLRLNLPGSPVRRTSVVSLEQLLRGPVGKRIQYSTGEVWRDREHLRFVSNPQTLSAETEYPVHWDDCRVSEHVVVGPFGRLSCSLGSTISGETGVGSKEITVDAGEIVGQLRIRRWRAGDRFQPFGMTGSKKVKSFLTDEKVDASHRKSVHVLCDDKRIVWVLGMRMDERYRVDNDTTSVIHFSWVPES